jgi:hypothetical protein
VISEYKGKQIAGRYFVDKETVVVFYKGQRKPAQIGAQAPEMMAKIILRELAAIHEAAALKRK